MEAIFPKQPHRPIRGTASFRWLAGEELVLMRSRFGKGGPPTSVSVIGGDYSSKSFLMLYSDERRVSRHYTMTLASRRWQLERHGPGFHQRFRATLSKNQRQISGAWEASADGKRWAHDFALRYRKK